MAQTEHRLIPFSELHVSRLRYGLSTALVVNGGALAAEGVGDCYLATNTGEIYVCLSGTTWTLFASGGGGGLAYSGNRREMNADKTIPGADAGYYLDWSAENWDTDAYSTGDPVIFNQPEPGFYQYQLHLRLGNTDAGRWHIELNYDNTTIQLQTEFYCNGDGNPQTFSLSGQFYATKGVPDADAYSFVYLYHNTPTDQDILAYSFMTLQRIGDAIA